MKEVTMEATRELHVVLARSSWALGQEYLIPFI